jgi:hypothetical protein
MTDEHPDLIDNAGERWWWTEWEHEEPGYQCRELFCLYSREDVERHFGPVREVTS